MEQPPRLGFIRLVDGISGRIHRSDGTGRKRERQWIGFLLFCAYRMFRVSGLWPDFSLSVGRCPILAPLEIEDRIVGIAHDGDQFPSFRTELIKVAFKWK